jgi:pimeloyl-ACP methyl ester carboxylesterase
MDDGVDAVQIDLEVAANKVCQVVALQSTDVILVGHGEGGAIITQAHSRCSNKIKALVYVAAIVPLDGETSEKRMNEKRDGFSKCLERDEQNQLFKVKKDCKLSEMYFNDLKENEKPAWLATLVMNEPLKISTTPMKLHGDSFEEIPKYYIEATEDKMLTLESQKEIENRIKWTKTFELNSGHCPFVSKPKDLGAKLIEIAVPYIKK